MTLNNGSKANVIAWIWARTVTCPNPACGATMPLVRSFWLGKKKSKEAWVDPIVEGQLVRFKVSHLAGGPDLDGTVTRGGAVCLVCETTVPFDHIRSEGRAGRIGAQLMAIAAEGVRQRVYLEPTSEHLKAAEVPKPAAYPAGELFDWPGRINVVRYGYTEFHQLFTRRQLTTLLALSDLVAETRSKVYSDAHTLNVAADAVNAYADAIATYVALAVDRISDRNSAFTGWDSSPSKEQVRGVFARQAIPMVWDFAECDPFGRSSGCIDPSIEWVASALDHLAPGACAEVSFADARRTGRQGELVATDPPYYDNIGYADLSDFFYIWLRRAIMSIYPQLFGTMLTPKTEELIATPYRHDGSREAAEAYFEKGFIDVFARCQDLSPNGYPLTLFYAFKQSADSDDGGIASTGWSTMLEGLGAAGWMVTATWPMRTEMANRMLASGSNALASSVVLACRPRPKTAGVTDRQGLIRALHAELPRPLRELQKAHIAPVDLRQAAIGPGMAVFSRFARVIEPDGSTMRVRTALGLINQVLGKVLDEQEEEFDSETRWAIQWFSQFYADEGPYGVAEQLAVSMNVAVRNMVDSGILTSGGGKARLRGRDELPDAWDPTKDLRTPVWEATQYLTKRLETDGEASAGRLLRQLGGLGDSAQLLAYRLYTVCETSRPALAGPYNALVASWPEIQRHAREANQPAATIEQQTFGA